MSDSVGEDRQARWDSYYRQLERPPSAGDDWVKKHLAGRAGNSLLELGCGLGQVSESLHKQGYRVVATDIAAEPLARLGDRVPDITTLQVDMQQPLPFPDSVFDLVIADLCLHYFDTSTTQVILAEVVRVLAPTGMLLARVNSDEDYNHGAGSGGMIEPGFFEEGGHYKRFFDEEMVEQFLAGWTIDYMERARVHGFGSVKNVFEIVARPSQPKPIPYVTIEQMTREVRDYIVAGTLVDYVWTNDWSPLFYRAQARLGFIAVAHRGPDGAAVLTPQLQESYAVLDWADLNIDRGVDRILERGRVEREQIRLVIDRNPQGVLDGLSRAWGDQTWLLPDYVRLMGLLASEGERAADSGFRLLATTLFAADEPVAGELGYAIGRVYVSLSGFFRRERPEWNHFGKLQMVLLARRLEAAGFAFWNLGHPYMEYKTRLGAKVVPRVNFLPRWDAATEGDVPEMDP